MKPSLLLPLFAQVVLSQPAIPTNVVALSVRHGVIPLKWDANTEFDLAGYYVNYGPISRNYTNKVWAGTRTNFNLGVNETTILYLAVTAVNILGLESDPSNEVVTTAYTNRPVSVTGLVTVVVANGLSSSRYPAGPRTPIPGTITYMLANDNARFFHPTITIEKGPLIITP